MKAEGDVQGGITFQIKNDANKKVQQMKRKASNLGFDDDVFNSIERDIERKIIRLFGDTLSPQRRGILK